jgi:hypothetical protein
VGESDVLLFGECREEGYCCCNGVRGCDQERLATIAKFSSRKPSDASHLFGICRIRGFCDAADCGLCVRVTVAGEHDAIAKAAQSMRVKKQWEEKRKLAAASSKSG